MFLRDERGKVHTRDAITGAPRCGYAKVVTEVSISIVSELDESALCGLCAKKR